MMIRTQCADCTNLNRKKNRCGIRNVRIREPLQTNCANHNKADAPISGPLFAIVEETRGRAVTTHCIPYWRNRRPSSTRYKLFSSDTGIAAFDDGRADIRQFDSVSDYLNAYLDEYRAWATEIIKLPIRSQLYLLVMEEWNGDKKWTSHGFKLVATIYRTKEENLGDYGWLRWVAILLEAYFQCEYPAAVHHILEHQSVRDALRPFIAAARAEIAELREFKSHFESD
jgi:hypothetical protein